MNFIKWLIKKNDLKTSLRLIQDAIDKNDGQSTLGLRQNTRLIDLKRKKKDQRKLLYTLIHEDDIDAYSYESICGSYFYYKNSDIEFHNLFQWTEEQSWNSFADTIDILNYCEDNVLELEKQILKVQSGKPNKMHVIGFTMDKKEKQFGKTDKYSYNIYLLYITPNDKEKFIKGGILREKDFEYRTIIINPDSLKGNGFKESAIEFIKLYKKWIQQKKMTI